MDKPHKRQWMREVAFHSTFRLDGVTRGVTGDLVICGHYDDVQVVTSYQYHSGFGFACVTLRHGGVSSSMFYGECYKKVLVDILRAALTGRGRLWRLKDGYFQHFVDVIRERWPEEVSKGV